jgi:hypothetical protein
MLHDPIVSRLVQVLITYRGRTGFLVGWKVFVTEKLYERACIGYEMLGKDSTMSCVLRERYDPAKSKFIEIRRYDTKKTLHGLCITVDLFGVFCQLLVLVSGVKLSKNT